MFTKTAIIWLKLKYSEITVFYLNIILKLKFSSDGKAEFFKSH